MVTRSNKLSHLARLRPPVGQFFCEAFDCYKERQRAKLVDGQLIHSKVGL